MFRFIEIYPPWRYTCRCCTHYRAQRRWMLEQNSASSAESLGTTAVRTTALRIVPHDSSGCWLGSRRWAHCGDHCRKPWHGSCSVCSRDSAVVVRCTVHNCVQYSEASNLSGSSLARSWSSCRSQSSCLFGCLALQRRTGQRIEQFAVVLQDRALSVLENRSTACHLMVNIIYRSTCVDPAVSVDGWPRDTGKPTCQLQCNFLANCEDVSLGCRNCHAQNCPASREKEHGPITSPCDI